jgi:predicted phage terminase large subunit-like protein
MSETGESVDAFVRRLAGLAPDARREALAGLTPSQQQAIAAALMERPLIKASVAATCVLTPRQQEAEALLDGPARHVLLYGGSRSSKTFSIVRKIAQRALMCSSRHAILRHTFASLHASVIGDTWPKMMGLCFPQADWKLDRQLWVIRFGNGSEVWFGGLSDGDAVERVLGQEHATLFFNEASQISFATRSTAITRLAQSTVLPLKAYYDANPPSARHWLHSVFIDKIDPNRHQPLADPEVYASLLMNPRDNLANLRPEYLAELEQLDERRRQRFLLGQWADGDEHNLWTPELLDRGRLVNHAPPPMQRVVVAVDPSGCSGPEDLRSDEVGIVVCGVGADGLGYITEDLSGRFGPAQWKEVVVSAYDRHGADLVVAEVNYGGSMVAEVIRTAVADGGYPVNFREVTASRGKVVRAEPIATLWSQNRVCLVGRFTELEAQMLAMTTAGYRGDRSPDRLDAMVWGLTALFPAMAREARDAAAGPDGPRRHREPRVVHSQSFMRQHGPQFQAIRGHRR